MDLYNFQNACLPGGKAAARRVELDVSCLFGIIIRINKNANDIIVLLTDFHLPI